MINCEFNKNYLINLIIGVIFSVTAIAFTIVSIVLKIYATLIAVLVIFIVAFYFIIRYFRYKKQYLKFDSNSFEGRVVAVKGAKPMIIKGGLSFILSAYNNRNVLVLKNERGQDLEIYNLVNAKKTAEDINNLLMKKN